MLPWSPERAGRIDEGVVDSALLRDNPLGDPHQRPVYVYLPPGYDESDRRYPVVYVIQGYTGHVRTWLNREPFRRPFPDLVDELFATGGAPPAIVVFVDAWTSWGGSQFVDSPATGRYHSYLCDEVVAWVDARYRTIADRDHRAITGKSSGGYGAMITPILRPDLFAALATHAGDALFEVCYQPFFPAVARMLRDEYDGSYESFRAGLAGREVGTRDSDHDLIEIYGCSAAYSGNPDASVSIPFDDNGVVVDEVWSRWLANDPVRLAADPTNADTLRSLHSVWIDAGTRDEYYLDLGARAFHRALAAAGVDDENVHFETFPAGHGNIGYRYPLALAWLCRRFP
ncbi:enterochelin esterase [Actinophytocola xinjiangensis]|uniref:Enterochelin esterase n=1 Tax=Actinophytocola xinjiangensis TaxID=485602 RepID=A0A7Z0WID1_9PSEU|nr:alpha/beta hydrolase-fold protein [Actinophytocola xinjiangensis]OLF07471.1 enterochelin esterase [Actinophytocola xinjiangensis]